MLPKKPMKSKKFMKTDGSGHTMDKGLPSKKRMAQHPARPKGGYVTGEGPRKGMTGAYDRVRGHENKYTKYAR